MNQFMHDKFNTPESQTRPGNVGIRINVINVAVRNTCVILGSFLENT